VASRGGRFLLRRILDRAGGQAAVWGRLGLHVLEPIDRFGEFAVIPNRPLADAVLRGQLLSGFQVVTLTT